MIRWPLLGLCLLLPLTELAAADEVDFQVVVAELTAQGDALVTDYVPERGAEAGDAFSGLYFDVFEDSGMELAVGLHDPALKTELESLFGAVIGEAMAGAPRSEVDGAWQRLRSRLHEVAAAQDAGAGSGFWSAFLQSFLILLREGFEAMLVVTALATYLRRAGAVERLPVIWHGVGWALAASLLTAWLLHTVFVVSGTAREALEGVTMLVASAVLFYVSYWLFARREAARWQCYIQGQINLALSRGSLFSLGFAAFLAVYREGAETVLFYQALVAGSSNHYSALASGFALAALALAGLYWLMRTASYRLPMGLFFSATAGLLYYLAVVFAGKGVLELQEAHWLSITPLNWLPRIEWLGLLPTAESVTAQVLLLLPLPLAWWILRRTRRSREAAA